VRFRKSKTGQGRSGDLSTVILECGNLLPLSLKSRIKVRREELAGRRQISKAE